ncbi:MAG: ATP-binding protein [Cyclobacteriaceae bacterium]|nr:ATP-binding protein [Cyclobacteriaceae bacterium HetDA_MAG_MS6]
MKVTLSWSGGKDSCLALSRLLNDPIYEVVGLHTVINQDGKVGIHEVDKELVKYQADSLGLPLTLIETTSEKGNYDSSLKSFYQDIEEDIDCIGFGDIYLQELRAFKEQLLTSFQLEPIFPLWNENTSNLLLEFVKNHKARVCAVQPQAELQEILGHDLSTHILNLHIDPCGENGEYHSFVYDGSVFQQPIPIQTGGIFEKSYQLRNSEDQIGTYKQLCVALTL